MKHRRYLKITAILLVIGLLAGGLSCLVWDNNQSSSDFYDMDRAFLQGELNRLPVPTHPRQGEASTRQGRFKGLLSYYIEPFSPDKAAQYNAYLQGEAARYMGTYVPLSGVSAGALVAPYRYTPVLKALGYGWYSRKGNLYADSFGREQAKGLPNYRYAYEFYLVKETVSCKILIFCNQGDPEKALSAGIDFLSSSEEKSQ